MTLAVLDARRSRSSHDQNFDRSDEIRAGSIFEDESKIFEDFFPLLYSSLGSYVID